LRLEESVESFQPDEEPEGNSGQKEDMRVFLNNMNSRIDVLVQALKQTDGMISKQRDNKSMIEFIREKRANNDNQKLADFFKTQI